MSEHFFLSEAMEDVVKADAEISVGEDIEGEEVCVPGILSFFEPLAALQNEHALAL